MLASTMAQLIILMSPAISARSRCSFNTHCHIKNRASIQDETVIYPVSYGFKNENRTGHIQLTDVLEELISRKEGKCGQLELLGGLHIIFFLFTF